MIILIVVISYIVNRLFGIGNFWKQAEIFLENGSTNAQLVLNLKAQSANDKVNIINAQNTIQRGYNTLMNLMQYPIDEVLEIEQVDIINLPESIFPGDNNLHMDRYLPNIKTIYFKKANL